ncbi:hypothetical protein FXF51_03195 [Nonomuraea sp. PA05]|uniref:caspase, EACC1-associated type n=1 Tax=Nonomuraea sp. PA05 TaxID=2604466 RepID=UPI0011D87808|nr:caspase family protein [Nonomuraea sp. PA05]TYB70106.1 hypothetical protein FXF51_03195 [Nonomuraea sp. PA05]
MAEGGLLLAAPGARVLLIGSGRHGPGSRLPGLPAVAATVTGLRRCLVDRAGLDPAAVTTLLDPEGPAQVAEALYEAARQAEDVLLVYYVGHGVVTADGRLHLATAATVDVDDGPAEYQALPYRTITDALAAGRAARTLLVLDCCYSGRAGAVARAMDELFDTSRHGLYILTAASRNERAWSPPGRPHTAFSGALIKLLDEGDPTAPATLTLRDCRSALTRTLTDAGLPRPRHVAADFDEQARLCHNQAAKPGAPDDSFSPYRGLASFGPDDAGYFFGRADLIRTLVNRVAELAGRPEPLIVTGASGAGKSSLLRAGLIPALTTSRTRVKLLHPGSDPVGELLRAFAAPGARPPLEEDPAAFRGLLTGEGGPPVLIVDQFEEVFTACRDEAARRTFIRALRASGAVVVIGVRADFFGHCARHAELHAALEHPVVVGPMTPGQLRQAIEGPAAAAGLELEDGLVPLLLRELGSEIAVVESAGILPLLSHALLATWQNRDGRRLTLAGYHATGGISGALARTADATLSHIVLPGQDMARRLLPRLVRLGEDSMHTRRKVPEAELLPPADSAAEHATAREVLDRFVDARLVTVDEDGVQLAHEALIRGWPQLQEWVESDRATLLLRQQLTDDARVWDAHDGDSSYLYQGTRLTAVEQARETWRANPGRYPPLGDVPSRFLEASQLAAARAARLRTLSVASLVVILLISLTGGVAAAVAARNAAVERDRSLSRELAAQSISAAGTDTSLSRALAVKAWHTAQTAEAGLNMRNALTSSLRTVLTGHEGDLQNLLVSADGKTVAATTLDDFGKWQEWLWQEDSPNQPRRVAEHHGPGLAQTNTFMSVDGGTMVISASMDEDLQRPDAPQVWQDTMPSELKPMADCPGTSGAALSADGEVLVAAAAEADESEELWLCRTTSPGPPQRLTGHRGTFDEVLLSDDGRTIAVSASVNDRYTSGVWVYNVDELDRPRSLVSGRAVVDDIAMSADGGTIVAVTATPGNDDEDDTDDEESMRIWEGNGQPRVLATGADTLESVAVNREATIVADGSALRLWNTTTTGEPITLKAPPEVKRGSVTMQIAGTTLVGLSNQQAWIWDVTRPDLLPRHLPDGPEPVSFLLMSNDGKTLAGDLDDGRIALWDLGAPQPEGHMPAAQDELSSLALSDDGSAMAASTDGRGWVWRLGESGAPRELTGHRGHIASVAMSADGTMAIAATTSAVVGRSQLWSWSATAPTVARRLTDLAGTVVRIAASADGKAVACLMQDELSADALRVWRDGKSVVNLRVSGGLSGSRLYISADGAAVAALAMDDDFNERSDEFLAWAVEEPGKPRQVRGEVDLTQPRFPMSADGRVLLKTSGGDAILLRHVVKTSATIRLTGQHGRVDRFDLSADGRTVVATTGNGAQAWLWNTADPGRPRRLSGHAGAIRLIRLSAAGRGVEALTTADEFDRQLWHWDITAPDRPRALAGHQGAIGLIDVSPSGDAVASAGVAHWDLASDSAVWLWQTSSPERGARLFGGRFGGVRHVVLTSDGKVAVGRGGEGTVWRWDLTGSSEPSSPFTGHRLPIGDIAMSANGRVLAGADVRGTVWIWDATSPGTPGRALRGQAPIVGVAVSADGRILVGYDDDGIIWAWDTNWPDRPVDKLLRVPDKVRDVALNQDGKVLAVATYSSGVLMWDPVHTNSPRSFTGLKGAIRKVALSSDGQILVGGGSGGEAWIWDARSSDQVGHLLAGHRSDVHSVVISTDQTTIASVDSEGHARIWSVAAHGQIGPQLFGLATTGADVALDVRGRTLVALDGDGDLQVWRLPAPPGETTACERLAARLHGTPEWSRHLGDLSVREACHP